MHRVGGFYSDFYVEPETGLLRAAVNYRKWRSDPTQPKPRKPIEQIPIGEGREYRKIKGIWYFLEFVLTEERIPRYYRGALVGVITEQLRTVTVKRQLGKKALKALGLRK